MNRSNEISNSIANIENELRSLAAKAAKAGNWRVVRAASEAAECLEPVNDTKNAADIGSKKKYVNKSPAKTSAYPQFVREDDELVKIGWSRSSKSEYRHKASWEIVELVARTVVEIASDTGVFDTSQLFPVIDPANGDEVPSYQGYMVLRWFREIGLVEQNGRSEYRVVESKVIPLAKKEWERLL